MSTQTIIHEGREWCLVSPEDHATLISAKDAALSIAQRLLVAKRIETPHGDLMLAPSKRCRRCNGDKPSKRGQRYCAACSKISRIESVKAYWQRRAK
jgi:hypothetical protein